MSDRSTFGTFGRYTEIPVDQMTPEQRNGYELVIQERGEAPGPYKILIQNPNLLRSWFLSESTFNEAILRCRTRNAKL
jgi:4-carboxymuconolactone decarboxylase